MRFSPSKIGTLYTTALVLAIGFAPACSEVTSADLESDSIPPTMTLSSVSSAVDSVLSFSASVKDNLGIKRIHIEASGGVTAQYDSVFTSAVTTTDLLLSLSVARSVPAGTPVTVVGTVTDGAGNQSVPDTLNLTTGNLTPASVALTSPSSGSAAVIGKSIVISLSGTSKIHVRWLGFTTNRTDIPADSTGFGSPLQDSVAVLDTIEIPTSASAGSLVITPFLRDSLGNRAIGAPVTLKIQEASHSDAPPTVNFGSDKRIEVSDTMFVSATDTTGAGIATLGYEIRQQIGGTVIANDEFQSDARFTSQQHTFTLSLPANLFSTFPQTIYVKAYATTGNGVKGYAKLSNGTDRVDTLTVVAGVTRRLPNGGSIADVVYHPGHDKLYLTNIERDQLEVFDLDATRFDKPIAVGSRPWGITVWPRDRSGNVGDTLLIANSGGTSIGYVDLDNHSNPLSPEGKEIYRYPLPNLVAYTVTTVLSQTGAGPIQQRTVYDFSDRPQYVASTCRTTNVFTSQCQEVVLVYSTTPTPGQTVPFPNRGTIRYENLTTKQSHFFFEQAVGQSEGRSDTLEVERFGAGCVDASSGVNCVGAEDSLLVPATQRFVTPHTPLGAGDTLKTLDTTDVSVVVQIDKLAFRDTTYVRSSGNFRRAIFGEGGNAFGSRVVAYDAMRGLDSTVTLPNGATQYLPTPMVDKGISRPMDVTDFIANSNARVRGVGINFDGELSAVRADSIYLLDPLLRLQGTIQTPTSGNPGFDFHPSNAGNGITSPMQSCYLFAASTEPVIEVYENHHYQLVLQIPVKAPIIGPIKAARRTLTGQLILIGATAQGVVTVPLSDTYRNLMNACPQ
jgi:hypothetical protein